MPTTGACRVGSVWRHKRSGGLYVVLGTAEMQQGRTPDPHELDGSIMVLYREGAGLRRFVRELAEFEDRFDQADLVETEPGVRVTPVRPGGMSPFAALGVEPHDGPLRRERDEARCTAIALARRLRETERWPRQHVDHACGRCVPGGAMVDPAFVCALHRTDTWSDNRRGARAPDVRRRSHGCAVSPAELVEALRVAAEDVGALSHCGGAAYEAAAAREAAAVRALAEHVGKIRWSPPWCASH